MDPVLLTTVALQEMLSISQYFALPVWVAFLDLSLQQVHKVPRQLVGCEPLKTSLCSTGFLIGPHVYFSSLESGKQDSFVIIPFAMVQICLPVPSFTSRQTNLTWLSTRDFNRLRKSEFTQNFWVFSVYIADFWQTFWVIWEKGQNDQIWGWKWAFLHLKRLKNQNYTLILQYSCH